MQVGLSFNLQYENSKERKQKNLRDLGDLCGSLLNNSSPVSF